MRSHSNFASTWIKYYFCISYLLTVKILEYSKNKIYSIRILLNLADIAPYSTSSISILRPSVIMLVMKAYNSVSLPFISPSEITIGGGSPTESITVLPEEADLSKPFSSISTLKTEIIVN